MAKFEASISPTRQEEDASEGFFTAYIDVINEVGNDTPEDVWQERISVHGVGKEGAEAFRDEVLNSLKLTSLIKETLK